MDTKIETEEIELAWDKSGTHTALKKLEFVSKYYPDFTLKVVDEGTEHAFEVHLNTTFELNQEEFIKLVSAMSDSHHLVYEDVLMKVTMEMLPRKREDDIDSDLQKILINIKKRIEGLPKDNSLIDFLEQAKNHIEFSIKFINENNGDKKVNPFGEKNDK